MSWKRGPTLPLNLPMLGLGGSVGTPPQGISAAVLVVSSFDELEARAEEARGKIVLFDPDWVNYGFNVQYRRDGAVAAARVGAGSGLYLTGGNEEEVPGLRRVDSVVRITRVEADVGHVTQQVTLSVLRNRPSEMQSDPPIRRDGLTFSVPCNRQIAQEHKATTAYDLVLNFLQRRAERWQ